ncbi:MAG: site-2 protease family protein [Clostridiales bacterium]|nr:site-2 protease family protein [Clostridiales bacterium]
MIFAYRYAQDPLDYFIILILTLIAVVISLVLHELAHGLVAKWNGDYTAKYAGRLTLNPLKHIDPIGFLMMMLVGFGYAKPVPVNPANFKHYRRGLITVAIAGVVVNLIIAFVGALGYCLMTLAFNHAVINLASNAAIRVCWYLLRFFGILVSLNLCLLFFNILPIFPLDGFRVIEALTHRGNKFCAFMRINGRYILYGLVGLSFIVSTAMENFANIPSWFQYLDVLGTYLNFFSTHLSNWFAEFWWLMVPLY